MFQVFIGSAVVMGLAGSLHCVGMCGPIALSLPMSPGGKSARGLTTLLYFFGKTITYILLGIVFGMVGHQLVLAGLQRTLSIVLGVAMLLFAVGAFLKPVIFHSNSFTLYLGNKLSPLMGKMMSRPGYFSPLGLGLLNGLLPCGLVYVALSAAVATGTVWWSAAFMGIFGVATMPLMLSMVLFANQLNAHYRSVMRRWLPLFTAVIAVLLILRGLDLGIPYLSPQIDGLPEAAKGTAVECH